MVVAFMRETTWEGDNGKGRESEKKGRFTNTRIQSLEEETQGHGGSTFPFVLEASRWLASASILLKLRSRTGLINTLEKTINLFAPNNRVRDKVHTCRHPLRGILPGPRAGHSP